MQFFADTAEIEDIKKLHAMGLLDGITTNPSLIAKSGRQFKEVIKEICGVVPGPVSAEVASTDYDTIMQEGHVLAKLADNVVVKLPLTIDGLRACKALTGEGIKTNVTLCFSPNQALLAAKCGATYISPFHRPPRRHQPRWRRTIEADPPDLRQLQLHHADPRRLSIRTPNHITRSGPGPGRRRRDRSAGGDFYQLADHPADQKSGSMQFVKDWKSTGLIESSEAIAWATRRSPARFLLPPGEKCPNGG